jgi:cell wall assembly regulator SMI1
MAIKDLVIELKKFSNEILTIGLPVERALLTEFETKYNVVLPNDYKELLHECNGVNLYGTQILGISKIEGEYALGECYKIEHYEVQNPMPLYLIPFSPDGRGNHYCFDTRFNDETSCPIVFWQHDYAYSENDSPEITNQGLADWIQEVMIDWILEDYNYDGTEK